jgi:hypothetical protein
MLIKDSYHISYCTNIHPGQDWRRTRESLEKYLPAVKSRVSNDQPFGVGLRLSDDASRELGTGDELKRFRAWLEEEGLYVFTMNGFPYGNFHGQRVKDLVHSPDWTTNERLEYTRRLFDQLAYLLPRGMAGGISTSPVSYKHWFTTLAQRRNVLQRGAGNMATLVCRLHQLERDTGTMLHLDIEPEPDGLLENSTEVVAYFKDFLEPVGIPVLKAGLGVNEKEAKILIYRHIRLCYDICHFSLAYEAPSESFKKFEDAGVAVGKIQVSAALKVLFNEGKDEEVWQALSLFNEPTYLHQVTERRGKSVFTYPDLPAVLENRAEHKELRAHFHVPVFVDRYGVLHSTQDQILAVLEYMKKHTVTSQLEIETYTWDVLPVGLKKPLTDSIVRELEWLKEKL